MSLICKFNDLENEFNVEFVQSSEHIVMLTSLEPLPDDVSGFVLTREDRHDNWDYSDYTTIYRKISKTQVQYSNDGSVYVPPTKTVVVQAFFNDGDNVYGVRPSEVTVTLYKNGKKSVNAVLKESKNYTTRYEDRLAEDEFTIEAPDLTDYTKNVSGTTVTYSIQIPQPRYVSTEDLAKIAMSNFEGVNPPMGIENLYASYCEQNIMNFNDVPESIKEVVETVIDNDKFMINEDGTVSLKPIN